MRHPYADAHGLGWEIVLTLAALLAVGAAGAIPH